MSLRTRNASSPRRKAASTLRTRKAAKKIKVIVAPVRKSNPPKRKRPARKSSLALHSVVALAPKRKRRSSKKKGLRKRKRNPTNALTLAPSKSAGVKRSLTRLVPASKGGGYKLGRNNNPPKRKRRALARRRKNPSFDVKSILMKGGILIAGAFVANYITPKIEGLLVGLFAGDLPAAGDAAAATTYKKSIQDNLSMLGYVELLGAVGTIALGEYLQQKFGSDEVDLKPATYAIATHMALRGISNAFPSGDTEAAVSANVAARVSELAASQGMTSRYGGQHGRYSGLSGTLNGVMGGTMGYGPGPSLSALRPGPIVDGHRGLPSYSGGANQAMLGSHPMHGSIMTDAEIGPAVVPHNPMAGLL
jgi:hypothetical protein